MVRTILFTLFMTTAIGAGLSAPVGALAGYLWFALFRPQEWVWIYVTAFRFSLVLGIILLLRSIVSGAWPDLRHRFSWLILAFLVTGLVAQTNAVRQDIGWAWLDFFARLTLVSLLTARIVDSRHRFFLIVLVICSSLGFHTSKAGVASFFGGGVRLFDGLGGAFTDSNGYAIAGVMIIPLLIATAATLPADWPFRKFFVYGYRAAAPLTAFAVVSTFSRSGFLALAAVGFVGILLQRRRFLWLTVCALTLFIALPFIPLPAGYNKRLDPITTYEEVGDESAVSRLHFWRVAWKMAEAEPLGVGMYNFNANYDKFDSLEGQYGHDRSVHNSHLQVLAEQGFLGFGIWCWLFIDSMFLCVRLRSKAKNALAVAPDDARFVLIMANALIASITAFLVGGTFIAMALNDLTWVTFGLVVALDRLAQALPVTSPAALRRVAGRLQVAVATPAAASAH